MFRTVIFWTHLVCGVATGLVVLMMSVTGVLLTYERQMAAWAERPPSAAVSAASGAARQPLDALLATVRAGRPEFAPTTVTLRNDPAAPLTVSAGRTGSLFVDPYTGAVAAPQGQGLAAFFAAVRGWHRWFNASAENRALPRAITGASNLAFLFLILSGMYLWLPRVFKWAAFRTRLLFNDKATTAKARDFNWHHVFGIWSAVPLAIVVATATVFSYPWASDLVYRAYGEQPPARGGARGGGPAAGGPPGAAAAQNANAGGRGGPAAGATTGGPAGAVAGGQRAEPQRAQGGPAANPGVGASAPAVERLSFDALFASAAAYAGEWRTLTLTLPNDTATTVQVAIDRGDGGQPQLRGNVTLDAATGAVTAAEPFSSQTPGRRARSWIRFLHTGEALGLTGQTIAGLVSLTSVLMVWTGLALAWRRLVSPLLARRRS